MMQPPGLNRSTVDESKKGRLCQYLNPVKAFNFKVEYGNQITSYSLQKS